MDHFALLWDNQVLELFLQTVTYYELRQSYAQGRGIHKCPVTTVKVESPSASFFHAVANLVRIVLR